MVLLKQRRLMGSLGRRIVSSRGHGPSALLRLPAGATLILDARDISGVADGGDVATFPDSSGNAFDATQSTAGARPTYRASVSTLKGQPAAEFTRLSSHWMVLPTLAAGVSDWTAYVVIDQTSTNQQRVFDAQAGRLTFDPATPAAVGYFDGSLKSAGTSATGAQCLTFVCEATTSGAIYRGRSALGTGLAYTQRALAGTFVSLGCSGAGASLFLDAKLACFAIYPTAHTATERTTTWNVIDSVWGVAA